MRRITRIAPVLAGMVLWSGCELLFPFVSEVSPDAGSSGGGGSSGNVASSSGPGSSGGTSLASSALQSSSAGGSSGTSASRSSSASAASSSRASSSASAASASSSSVAGSSSSAAPSSSGPSPVIALDDSYTTNEDVSLTRNSSTGVLFNDTSTLGAMTAVLDVGPTHASTFNLGANGSINYSPTLNFFGTDTFTYHVTSGGRTSRVATVTITVTSVNDTPSALDDGPYATAEDTLLTVNAATGVRNNDTDVDGDTLTVAVAASGDPAHGTLVLSADGSFTYMPAANYNGTDAFTYEASDGTATATATVSLTISSAADAPVAVADSYTALLNQALNVAAPGVLQNDTDGDGDALTAVMIAGPSHSTSFTLNANGSFAYTPVTGYEGADSFTYQARDPGSLSSATMTVSISVVNNNVAPTAVNDSYSTDEDTTLTVPLAVGVTDNDTDPEGATLTVTVVAQPFQGTLTMATDGSFVYVPAANAAGDVTFTYTASDGLATSNTATVTITVAAVNDAPVALDDTYAATEDTVLTVDATSGVRANDSDVETARASLTVSAGTTTPQKGALTLNADGSFTYTPNANANGADTFSYVVSDGTATDTATVTINIAEANDTPVATAGAFTVNEDQVHNGTVSATDPDTADPVTPDTLTFAVVDQGQHGTVAMDNAGVYTYTPVANYNGPDTFTFRVNDGTVNSNTATITITVTPVADAPTAADDGPYAVVAGFAFTLAAPGVLQNDSDADGTTPTAQNASTPGKGTVSLNADGSFTYTPGAAQTGADSFTYEATDGTLTGTATVSFNIAANQAPVGTADAYTAQENTALAVNAANGVLQNDTDADGHPLTAVLVTGPTHAAAFTLNADGSFSYTPAANYVGLDEFTYNASDSVATSAGTVVSLSVKPRDVARVSVAAAGTEGDGACSGTGMSVANDGLMSAFASASTNLSATDPNAATVDVFQKSQAGTVARQGGASGAAASETPQLSADGARLVFASEADLAGTDTNATWDVFLFDGATITLLSHTPATTTAGNGASTCPAISANGRYVAFASAASDLVAVDNGGFADVFVVDLNDATPTPALVSVSTAGTQADALSLCPSVSDTGIVVFASMATNLDAVDLAAALDVFKRDTVAATTELVSIGTGAVAADGRSLDPVVSADGLVIAFSSEATNLVAADANAMEDVFVRIGTTTTRASVHPGGAELTTGLSSMPALSSTGRYLAFVSAATDLVTGDTNTAPDLFVFDRTRDLVGRANLTAAGAQVAAGISGTRIGISPDGRYVIFASAAPDLVTGDTNGFVDIFVAPNPVYQLTGP